MSPPVESWDDDADFHGDLFTQSASSAAHTAFSLSSRAASVVSESLNGDDDWQVLIAPDDESSTKNAISSAKQAGIPIPTSVPSSALLGGTIKRLGKQPCRQKTVADDDDWGDDIELPGPSSGGLKLKTPQPPVTPAQDDDDFDDWAEGGSLGIRFAGTRRDQRARGSSVSAAMSPSLGSCMTLESEDDEFGGLVLPREPMDFNAMLRKRKETEAQDELTPKAQLPEEPSTVPEQPEEQEKPAEASAPAPAEETPHQPETETRPEPQAEVPSEPEPQLESHPEPQQQHQPSAAPRAAPEEDDFFADIDMGPGEMLDTNKFTLNRNIKVQTSKPAAPAVRAATTLTFTDKPAPLPDKSAPTTASRIPRPLTHVASRSKLDPVYESGAPQSNRHSRVAPTTTNAQLLRAKRSAPVLRSDYRPNAKSSTPFLPAGVSTKQSQHVTAKSSQPHLRRDSDPNRAQSPTPRAYSRLGRAAETPSRSETRKDIAPASLAREAATKRMFTKPARKRNFGDGTELEVFDDLPTSAAKENKFIKQPSNRPPLKMLRQVSHSKLPVPPERIQTPQPPQTPRSSTKRENTPSFARDTAASRIAREQRLGGTGSRQDGPLMPINTNWKGQVAARSPHTSPQANRKRGTGQKPHLIKQMSQPSIKNEKGMTYNPILQRWEGNEVALAPFSLENSHPRNVSAHAHSHSQPHLPSHRHSNSLFSNRLPTPTSVPNTTSPPRAPALISHISSARGVQVERGMVFDPRRMCWLKLDPRATDPLSPTASIGDESDPFADIEDLKDDCDKMGVGAGGYFSHGGSNSASGTPMDSFVSEEFDLGPEFIRRQREEEGVWRRRLEGWVGEKRDTLGDAWRWEIRHYSRQLAQEMATQLAQLR